MNRTLCGLVVMLAALGATVARADHFEGDSDCGPRPQAPPDYQTFNEGRYEQQTRQVWVPAQQQQIWVPGQCRHHHRHQQCSPGGYRTIWTPGRYEARQEWVWVPYGGGGYRRHSHYGYRAPAFGFHASVPGFQVSIR